MNVDLVDNTNEDIKNFVRNLYKTLQQKIIDEELATYKISENYTMTATAKSLHRRNTNYGYFYAGNSDKQKYCNHGNIFNSWWQDVTSIYPSPSTKTFDITNGAGSVSLGRDSYGIGENLLGFSYRYRLDCGHSMSSDGTIGLAAGSSTTSDLYLSKSLKYGIKKINSSHNKYQAFISKEGTFTDPVNIKLNRKFHYKRKKEKLQNIEKLLNKESEDNAFIFFVKDKLKELCGEVNLLYKTPISLNEEYKDFNQENKEYNISIVKQNIKILREALDDWGNHFDYNEHNEYDKYLFRIHLNMSLEHDRNQTLIVSMFYDNDLLLEFEAVGNLDFSNRSLANSASYTINITCKNDKQIGTFQYWFNWSISGIGVSFYRDADGSAGSATDWSDESNEEFRKFLSAYAPVSSSSLSKPTANTNVTIKKLKINNFYGLDCVSFIKEVFCDNSTTVINGIKNNIKVV